MAKFYNWTGALSTDLGVAGNWNDITDNQYPSQSVPGSADTGQFSGPSGTLSGSDTLAMAEFLSYYPSADWTVTGTLDATGSGISNAGVTLTIGATGTVVATLYNQFNGGPNADLDMLAGSQMTLTGAPNGIYLPNALNLGGIGTIDGGTLDAAGGGMVFQGSVLAEGGAQVTAMDTSVNMTGFPPATLTITGAGTDWHDVGSTEVIGGATYYVGNMTINGDDLLLSDHAHLTDDGVDMINQGGGATVSGDAIWTFGGITIGQNGAGTLAVQTGGTVTSAGGYERIGSGGAGVATVDGAGSVLSTTGQLIVGGQSVGVLTATDTAAVTVGSLVVGQSNGGSGTLIVGSHAVVDATGNGYGEITVGSGSGSTGLVQVRAGGTLEATGTLDPDNQILVIGVNGAGTDASGNPVAAATGIVDVTGPGALLSTGGNPAQIGGRGNGTLAISGGGTVTIGVSSDDENADAALSVGSSGNGVVSVSGSLSTLNVTGQAYFAHSGTASLTVTNGATFIGGDAVNGIQFGLGSGNGSGGSATATVSSGGSIKSMSNLAVGQGGDTGTLTITGGRVEATDEIRVGLTKTINGNVVGGTGIVDIGAGGTLLADGADITASGTSGIGIGSGVGSTGYVAVGGAGALLNAGTHFISIGNYGTGYLTVSGGGTVDAGTDDSADPAILLGSNGGIGELLVSGTLSTVDAAGQVDVGNTGGGVLLVTNQGTVETGGSALAPDAGLAIGWNAGSTGQVTVAGLGSKLVNIGGFSVGGSEANPTGGVGSLLIENGGLVTTTRPDASASTPAAAIAAQAGSDGSSVTVTGTLSTWQVTQNLEVGAAAAGSLAIAAAGTVTAGAVDIGVAAGAAGAVSVTGGGTLAVAGAITVGDAGFGQLSIFSGGTVTAASLAIGAQSGGSGFVDLAGAGSGLSVTGLLTVGGGALDVGAGATVTAGSVAVAAGGVVSLLGGSADAPAGLANAGAIGGYGTIDAAVANTGVITAFGGTEVVTGAVTGSGGALVVGNGGDLVLDGAVGSGQTVAFSGASGTLTLNDPAQFNAFLLTGFRPGDVIDAVGATGASLVGDALVLYDGANPIDTIRLAAAPTALTVASLVSNGVPQISIGAAPLVLAGDAAASGLVTSHTTLSASALQAGLLATGSGSAVLEGTGTTLDVSGAVRIGVSGAGTLALVGATLESAGAVIGVNATAAGTATLTGAHWTSTSDLQVAGAGAGTLDLLDGSSVAALRNFYLGQSAGATGDATISGGSTLSVAGAAYIGLNGTGVLTVATGGSLDGGSLLRIAAGSTLDLAGGTASSEGVSTVAGAVGISVVTGGRIIGYGTLTAPTTSQFHDNGVIEADGGTMQINAAVVGLGSMRIDAASTMAVTGALRVTNGVTFAGAGAVLSLSTGDVVTSVLSGFATGDAIDMAGINTATWNSTTHMLALSQGTHVLTQIDLAGNYGGGSFHVAQVHGVGVVSFA